MYFTREDIFKIHHGLSKYAVRDSEFPTAKTPINNNDVITMIQEGKNVKIRIIDFLEQLHLISQDDFLNVTVKFDETALSITQAARLVPVRSRKIGLVITFENERGKWEIWQYNSHNLTQWNNPEAWENVKVPHSSIGAPDEEDLTLVEKNERSIVKFKDKDYSPVDYSGLGKKYLRKNVVSVKDPETELMVYKNLLTQRMLNKENTIYIIQYDYDLNGQTITVPKNCILDFRGGKISNGNIIFENSLLSGIVSLDIIPSGTIRNTIASVDWFKGDTSSILQFILDSGVSEVLFGSNTYTFKEVLIKNNVIISGNSNTVFKPVLIKDEEPSITHTLNSCRNMLQSSVSGISVLIKDITFRSSITSNTLPSGYKTDKYASEPLLFFTGASKVEVTNCVFDSIEGNSYSNTNYTYYGNKKGLCLCCWDCDEVVIHSNLMTRLRMDEQFWSIAVHKERESLVSRFNNNHVVDMMSTSNSSLFSTVAGTVEFSGNYVNNFIYSGSLTNLFGTHVIAKNNVITNSQVGSVFDTSERGYFYAHDILISDNVVEALSGDFVVTISDIMNISNNKFRGFTFLTAENDASISVMEPQTYPYFYTKDNTKTANSYINISNNIIDLTYYDKTINRLLPDTYSKGINIRSWRTIGGKFIFRNNVMQSLQSFDNDDVNDMSNHSTVPFWISNMKQVIIQGNSITGGGAPNPGITGVKSVIWVGHQYTYDQGNTAYTLDELVISNNNFSTQGLFILQSTSSQYASKWYTVTKFEFIGNVSSSSKSIVWSLPVVFLNARIYGNINLQLSQYPFYNLYTDITDLGYRLGRISPYRKFREQKTNAIVHAADITSEYSYDESDIAIGTRLDVGTQVQMSDYSIWKNLGTVVSWQETSAKEIQEDTSIMKYQGVFWKKLLSRKPLIFDSPVRGTTEQRLVLELNSYYYGLIWYDTTLNQNFQFNYGEWYNQDGTLTSKVTII